jgi:hypothetical protein
LARWANPTSQSIAAPPSGNAGSSSPAGPRHAGAPRLPAPPSTGAPVYRRPRLPTPRLLAPVMPAKAGIHDLASCRIVKPWKRPSKPCCVARISGRPSRKPLAPARAKPQSRRTAELAGVLHWPRDSGDRWSDCVQVPYLRPQPIAQDSLSSRRSVKLTHLTDQFQPESLRMPIPSIGIHQTQSAKSRRQPASASACGRRAPPLQGEAARPHRPDGRAGRPHKTPNPRFRESSP